jgi:leader peptidase (prepilin peptidase) / N-methyltransferase
MTIEVEASEAVGSEVDPRPSAAILIGGACAIGLISALSLPWPVAIASTVLGTLMIAGADVDARTFLLPNLITFGAILCGILAAPLLDTADPWSAVVQSIARAGCVAGVLALFRSGYGWIRKTEGLGLGDVKLAAAIGAWLPFESIPLCFGLATSGALLTVMLARLSGQAVMRTTRIPLGAFLCPALWIVYFADSVTR